MGQLWWDGWVAETTSLLNWRTGNRTGGSNPPLTAERKPQVVDKQTLAALFVSWKMHGKCTDFFTLSWKTPFWGGSNGFLPHFNRCWMSGFSPQLTALGSLYAPKCTIFRCNLPPKKMHFRQCRGFICNKCPTYLSPKSSHTSRQIGILHYSIKVFVGYWDILRYYPSHRKYGRPDDESHPVFVCI